MHGSYTETVVDGIMYRLIECDDVEIFADRGLNLCVSSTNFYDVEAYNYNEETGEITPNPGFDGVNVCLIYHLTAQRLTLRKPKNIFRSCIHMMTRFGF